MISQQCEALANVFHVTANLRDAGVDPLSTLVEMNAADLPADVKASGPDIIALVYGPLAKATPDQIAQFAYSQCVKHSSGVRRST